MNEEQEKKLHAQIGWIFLALIVITLGSCAACKYIAGNYETDYYGE